LENYRTAKESGNKVDIKSAKKELNSNYTKLKQDAVADKGKHLYAQGNTITSNNDKYGNVEKIVAATGMAAIVGINSSGLGNTALGQIAEGTIALGAVATNVALVSIQNSKNRQLRAYYAHED
jgi:hypothetical protein